MLGQVALIEELFDGGVEGAEHTDLLQEQAMDLLTDLQPLRAKLGESRRQGIGIVDLSDEILLGTFLSGIADYAAARFLPSLKLMTLLLKTATRLVKESFSFRQ